MSTSSSIAVSNAIHAAQTPEEIADSSGSVLPAAEAGRLDVIVVDARSYPRLPISSKSYATVIGGLLLISDSDILHATTYRILCLSEATSNAMKLDPTIVARHPHIPWPQIRAIGNRLRHEYGDTRADIIWETVRGNDVSSLLAVARSERERYPD